MEEYGVDKWSQQQNEDLIYNLDYQKTQIDTQITEVNKKRKYQQMLAAERICKAYAKTQELVQKNLLLEQELVKLRERAGLTESNKRQKLS